MVAPTAGDCVVMGRSIRWDKHLARRNVGICPQHNVLFERITVREHLVIYGALKGVPANEMEAQVANWIDEIGLSDKALAYASSLSGGMKRKLQVLDGFFLRLSEGYGALIYNDTLGASSAYDKPHEPVTTVLHNASGYHSLPAFLSEVRRAKMCHHHQLGQECTNSNLLVTRTHPIPLTTHQSMQGLVEERETRQREVMLIMGLREPLLVASWSITYGVVFGLSAFLCTTVVHYSFFPSSSYSLLLVFFLSFMLSEIPFAFLVASFFSRAKLAAIVGPFLQFMAVMPRYIFFKATDGQAGSGKLMASVLSPTAFTFGADTVGLMEGSSQGIFWASLDTGDPGLGNIILLMLLDGVLYAVLAWLVHYASSKQDYLKDAAVRMLPRALRSRVFASLDGEHGEDAGTFASDVEQPSLDGSRVQYVAFEGWHRYSGDSYSTTETEFASLNYEERTLLDCTALVAQEDGTNQTAEDFARLLGDNLDWGTILEDPTDPLLWSQVISALSGKVDGGGGQAGMPSMQELQAEKRTYEELQSLLRCMQYHNGPLPVVPFDGYVSTSMLFTQMLKQNRRIYHRVVEVILTGRIAGGGDIDGLGCGL
eukprot:gene33537-43099_t